eukprot:s2324_g7.t1
MQIPDSPKFRLPFARNQRQRRCAGSTLPATSDRTRPRPAAVALDPRSPWGSSWAPKKMPKSDLKFSLRHRWYWSSAMGRIPMPLGTILARPQRGSGQWHQLGFSDIFQQ